MFRRSRGAVAAVLLAAGVGLAACAGEMGMEKASLFDRLGGEGSIRMVVAQFVANMAADERINQRFADTDMNELRAHLTDQICEATGGSCTYTGRDMMTTHKGMNITEEEFNWTGAHLQRALAVFSVPETEQNELLAAIGAMQGEIVGM